jgi:periplasmic protein TonB
MRHALISTSIAAALMATFTAATPAAASDAAWQKQVATRIAANHSYPRAAQVRGDEGTARIRIVVDASGAVSSTSIVQSSGSEVLDREAERIITRAAPLPSPGSQVNLVVPITWSLK